MEIYEKKTKIEVLEVLPNGDRKVQNLGDSSDKWIIPKEVFKSTYVEYNTNYIGCFGRALQALELGNKVARKGWNGKGMYIVMVVPTCDYASDSVEVFKDIAKESDHSCDILQAKYVETDPYLVMRTAKGTAQPGWLASQADMLAKDWVIVSE